VIATGGGGAGISEDLAGVPVAQVPEFQAWARGAPILADLEGVELPECYLLVSLGTGTSILRIRGDQCDRAGGSALGGGTLLGLGRLLLGTHSFEDVMELAARGDRRKVDLLVGDIYGAGTADMPLPAEINAASFGKLESTEPHDLAHALIGLIGENVGLMCGQLARAMGADAVLYCGSTLQGNPMLGQILRAVSRAYGTRGYVLEGGAYCGAIGALSLAA
jgi:type II pantothenate kinase